RVDLPKRTVDAQATLQLRTLRPLAAISLDAMEFEVKEVRIGEGDRDEKPAHFEHDGRKLVVDLGSAWPAGREALLHVDSRVRAPRDGLHFSAPSEAGPDVPLMVWSQGEAAMNRYWIPCLDQPDQRQTTELVVTVADGFEVLSNGHLVERKSNADDKTV